MIITRQAQLSDVPYIIKTWLKSAKYSIPLHRRMESVEYFAFYRNHIIQLLESTNCVIACDDACPDAILAFMVFNYTQVPQRNLLVHYIFVTALARKKQLATSMITEALQGTATNTVLVSAYGPGLHHLKFNFLLNPYIPKSTLTQ